MSTYTGHCYYCGRIVNIEPDKFATYEEMCYNAEGEAQGYGAEDGFAVARCPECRGYYVFRCWGFDDEPESWSFRLIHPTYKRRPLPTVVPVEYKKDFEEAVSVSELSPKAAAALLRRFLQRLLREHFHIGPSNLSAEIDDFLRTPDLPTEVLGSIDVIRIVGNFSAHPNKSTNTGEIMDVYDDEVEWSINAIEALLDFAFVLPGKLSDMRTRLQAKIAEKEGRRERLK